MCFGFHSFCHTLILHVFCIKLCFAKIFFQEDTFKDIPQQAFQATRHWIAEQNKSSFPSFQMKYCKVPKTDRDWQSTTTTIKKKKELIFWKNSRWEMFRWPGEKWGDNKPEIIWNIKKKKRECEFFFQKTQGRNNSTCKLNAKKGY